MNPYELKGRILEAIQRAFGDAEQNPRRVRRGRMVRSNAPKQQKARKARSPRPRKPAPRGRAELVAKQKKARGSEAQS